MTTNEGRCEPPPEWRDRDGWHWVQSTLGDPVVRRWLAGPHSAWRHLSMPSTPELAYQAGYRYLAPVTPPATVAALVEALENMVGQWGQEACPVCGGDCASANPPISMCPVIAVMRARAALALYRGEAGR